MKELTGCKPTPNGKQELNYNSQNWVQQFVRVVLNSVYYWKIKNKSVVY